MDVRITAGIQEPSDITRTSLKQQNVVESARGARSGGGESDEEGGEKGIFGKIFGGFGGKEKEGL